MNHSCACKVQLHDRETHLESFKLHSFYHEMLFREALTRVGIFQNLQHVSFDFDPRPLQSRLRKMNWVANKRFVSSKFKFKFKFPRARNLEILGLVLGCIEAKFSK